MFKIESMEIKDIIFDLGGVLVDWNPKIMYRKIFHTEEAVDYFLTNICTFSWNEAQDGGRTIVDAENALINKYPEYTTEIKAYYARWPEMLAGSIIPSVEILRELIDDKRYRVFALTNWSAETWPKAIELFDFLSWFDGILVSGQELMKKPDKRIFNLLCDRYQIDPNQALFIDDNVHNIFAAREFGLHSIHFLNSDQLKSDLAIFLK